MERKRQILDYLINLSFILYFLILFTERVISVVLSLVNGFNPFGTIFDGYVYSLTFLSLIAFLVYLLIFCRPALKGIFSLKENDQPIHHLIFASGIILLSGMVHTEYTIPVVQFISYGILIIGLVLQTILNLEKSQNKVLSWLSLIYLVVFSMAIPVMYRSAIELHVAFHLLEGMASFILVITFVYLLMLLFASHNDLFSLLSVALVILFDVPILIMRWNEEINYFLLIFTIGTAALFIAGFLYSLISRKKKQ